MSQDLKTVQKLNDILSEKLERRTLDLDNALAARARMEKALRAIAAGSAFVLENRRAICWTGGDPYEIARQALGASQ